MQNAPAHSHTQRKQANSSKREADRMSLLFLCANKQKGMSNYEQGILKRYDSW